MKTIILDLSKRQTKKLFETHDAGDPSEILARFIRSNYEPELTVSEIVEVYELKNDASSCYCKEYNIVSFQINQTNENT